MLKKTIRFDDLDGNPVEEDYYFNLSKAEIIELEVQHDGVGLLDYVQGVVDRKDNRAMLQVYKDLLTLTVGRRSDDGKTFVKDQETRDKFLSSDAYGEMFFELFTDPTKIVEFFRGILPKDLKGKYDEAVKSQEGPLGDVVRAQAPEKFQPTGLQNREEVQVQLPPPVDGDIELTAEGEKRLLTEFFGPEEPVKPKALNEYTRDELLAMSTEDFKVLMGKDRHNVPRGLLNVAFERKTKKIDP